MTSTPHDQFAKEYLAGLLDPFGETQAAREVPSETRQIDLLFIPELGSDLSPLGLLGRIARTPCILEPYSSSPNPAAICACLLKLLIYQGSQQRMTRREEQKLLETEQIMLWIIAPTLSMELLKSFGAYPREDWPRGVYFMAENLRSVLVAVHQLPVIRETLWLRALGRGSVRNTAIKEVVNLASDDPLRMMVLRQLTNWKIQRERNQHDLAPV